MKLDLFVRPPNCFVTLHMKSYQLPTVTEYNKLSVYYLLTEYTIRYDTKDNTKWTILMYYKIYNGVNTNFSGKPILMIAIVLQFAITILP